MGPHGSAHFIDGVSTFLHAKKRVALLRKCVYGPTAKGKQRMKGGH